MGASFTAMQYVGFGLLFAFYTTEMVRFFWAARNQKVLAQKDDDFVKV